MLIVLLVLLEGEKMSKKKYIYGRIYGFFKARINIETQEVESVHHWIFDPFFYLCHFLSGVICWFNGWECWFPIHIDDKDKKYLDKFK